MPTVPTYDNFQVAPTNTPDVNFSAPSGPNGQQIAGQQLQDAGGAMQKAGDSAARIALSMAEQPGGHHPRVVHDQLVASLQQPGEVGEAAVLYPLFRPPELLPALGRPRRPALRVLDDARRRGRADQNLVLLSWQGLYPLHLK